MRFGVNTFVWASPFSTDKHLSLLDKACDMGFDVIELAIEEPALVDVAAVQARLRETGLSAIVCGAFGPGRNLAAAEPAHRQTGAEYVRTLIDMAAALGSPVVGGPMYGETGKPPAESRAARAAERERAAAELRSLAAYAGEQGVRLALELLNRFETDLLNVVDQGLAFVDSVGSPHMGLHLDTFHMHLEEKDSAAAIRQAGDRLFHFHACENDRGVPGSGQVDWAGVADALREIDYQGDVVIESFTPEVKSIARAVCIWRDIAPGQDAIATEGLAFLRGLLTSEAQGTPARQA